MIKHMTVRRPDTSEYSGIVDMLTEVRGRTHYNKSYYDANYLASGVHEIYAAYDKSDMLLGFMSISPWLSDNELCCLALLNIRPDYSGCNVAQKLFKETMDILASRNVSAIKAQVITDHTAAQSIVEKHNFIPTGMLYGFSDGNNMKQKKDVRTSFAIYVRNISVDRVKKIHVHREMADFTENVYENLGVKVNVANCGQLGKESHIEHFYNEHSNTLGIRVFVSGFSLSALIEELHTHYGRRPAMTTMIYLYLDNPSAICGYEILCDEGYIFSGLDPLGSTEKAVFYKASANLGEIRMSQMLENFIEKNFPAEQTFENVRNIYSTAVSGG